jgi:hypothetical protein
MSPHTLFFLTFEQRHQVLFDPGECSFQTFTFIEPSDFGLDFGRLSFCGQEMIRRHPFVSNRVHCASLSQDSGAGVQAQYRIPHPGLFQDLLPPFSSVHSFDVGTSDMMKLSGIY